jgi:transcriptional regulator
MEAGISRESVDLMRGTLDVLILRALMLQSTHGFGVARWIEQATDDALRIEEGSLYPALYRLEKRGLVESEWGFSDNNRKARFYKLTRSGRAQLRTETDQFVRFASVMFKALAIEAQPA